MSSTRRSARKRQIRDDNEDEEAEKPNTPTRRNGGPSTAMDVDDEVIPGTQQGNDGQVEEGQRQPSPKRPRLDTADGQAMNGQPDE